MYPTRLVREMMGPPQLKELEKLGPKLKGIGMLDPHYLRVIKGWDFDSIAVCEGSASVSR
jgi:hypothetical protein